MFRRRAYLLLWRTLQRLLYWQPGFLSYQLYCQLKFSGCLAQRNSPPHPAKSSEYFQSFPCWWYRRRGWQHGRLRQHKITFVVGISDGPESLLASSIPNLKLHSFVIWFYSFESKVDSDGGHVVFVELVVCESQQQAGFPHRWIPNDYVFEKVIILATPRCHVLSNYYYFDLLNI